MNRLIKYIIENNRKIKINSKDITVGDIFIALPGKNEHGNKYIKEAIKNDAKYIITNIEPEQKYNKNKIIIVKRTVNFLLEIAKQKRNLFKGRVIGITGSVGKTSVKENLRFYLSSYFKISASIKSYNNTLGVILSLLNLDLKSKFAIFELGTNNFNEIKTLTLIVRPSQVIITNIYPCHLEKLINTRNIAKEKSDILNKKYNPDVELAILSNSNKDEKYIINKAINNNVGNIFSFGRDINSDFYIKSIVNIDNFFSIINLEYKGKTISLTVNKNQLPRLENIIICLIFFKYNNIDLKKFISLTKKLPLIEGRGLHNKIKIFNKKINFIDESYNASPKSMKTCIDYFQSINVFGTQKKILILGEMKELGENALTYHEDLLNYVSKIKLENVIICGELMNMALRKNIHLNIKSMNNLKSILSHLKMKVNKNDVLCIKGSNSSLANKLGKELLKIGSK